MKIEQVMNNKLNNYPKVKRYIKRWYQYLNYFFSRKIKSKGDIRRITPKDNYEYFFGYYDKSPWDITDRFILCLRVKDTTTLVAPKEKAEIILIDTKKSIDDPNRIRKLGETSSWNVQQGCMLQWLGPDFSKKIIYNDFRNKKFCSIILNIETLEEEIIEFPIYTINRNGNIALSLDFTRLHKFRPGYGYSNEVLSRVVNEKVELEDVCIWKVDILNNKSVPLLRYKDLFKVKSRKEFMDKGVIHKVNHLMLNPIGNRFMFLHRWYKDGRKYSRLITSNLEGEDLYVLSDDNMVSHCCWKNNTEILGFMNKFSKGNGYYLLKDKEQSYIRLWENLVDDGHPSYDITKNWILTDTYPDRKRLSKIKLLSETGKQENIAEVFAPFKYDNDLRCDLHPRWSRKGKKICFDSVFEGKRGVYEVELKIK